jgi:hypothetical protein
LEDHEFRAAQRIVVANFVIEVAAVTRDGAPASSRFHVERPVEDPSSLFVHPQPLGLAPVVLPPVGESMQLAAPSLPRPLPP